MDQLIELYELAIEHYNNKNWDEAARYLEQVFSLLQNDESADKDSRIKLVAEYLVFVYTQLERFDLAKPYSELLGKEPPKRPVSDVREPPDTW